VAVLEVEALVIVLLLVVLAHLDKEITAALVTVVEIL
jgi:hypothetical protein